MKTYSPNNLAFLKCENFNYNNTSRKTPPPLMFATYAVPLKRPNHRYPQCMILSVMHDPLKYPTSRAAKKKTSIFFFLVKIIFCKFEEKFLDK